MSGISHHYLSGPPRQVPGLDGLHKMTGMLLAEMVPADGRVLVLGAGGGMELKALAETQPSWQFDGVDPSAEMLALAREVTAPFADRVSLHEGKIDAAPEGPFDGAVCLLTFHFIDRHERAGTLAAIRARLKPGAPLVLAHISFSQEEAERTRWVARHAGYPEGRTAEGEKLQAAQEAMTARLTILPPEEDEAMLEAAGFEWVTLFYAALSFRGWIGYAGSGG
jgi:tRNA (cmo5U34)-methyltransferase